MKMNDFPLPKVFTLIESGPVLLISTHDPETGKNNMMTLSWSMVLGFDPASFAIMTGEWNYSFMAMMKTQECVVAVPGVDLIEKVVKIGDCSGDEHDKFEEFSMTPLKASKVQAPLIGECLANIECKVSDYIEKYGIIIMSPVKAWVNEGRKEKRVFHAIGDGTFIADGEKFDYRKDMWDKLPDSVK